MKLKRLTRSGRLINDRRGATAVETGFVLLPFLMLIIGIIEIGYQYTTASLLDAGALRASRFGMTGQSVTNAAGNAICRSDVGNTINGLRNQIVRGSGNFLVNSRIGVNVRTFGNVGNAGNASIVGTNSLGSGGSIVRYSLTYPQPFLTLAWTRLFGGPSQIVHTANVFIKNEPFQPGC